MYEKKIDLNDCEEMFDNEGNLIQVKVLSAGQFIPADPINPDFQAYLKAKHGA